MTQTKTLRPTVGFGIGLLLMLTMVLSGCGGYGEVSEGAYELATATYSACLAKSEERLGRIESLLEDPAYVEKMSEEEVKWMRAIIAKARNGNWQAAADKARRMMEDQVNH